MTTTPEPPLSPTIDVVEGQPRHRAHPQRELPPDIITMEIEVGSPIPGPDTVGHDSGEEPRPTAPRRRLGRFSVLGVLGRGGMGTVLEAYDDTLARTVALKLLHGRVDASRKDRLLREAQALAQLSHPNVVQVYEVGLVEDQMFIAMELVEGETLRAWQRARRPWREVVEVYLQAGRGLWAAHGRDLVHRDVKPENCIIGHDGVVKVLDFGLARSRKTEHAPPLGAKALEDSALRRRMTQSGKVMGTLSYLPLAQLMGYPADVRSDQFSFCVSLYEALYGVLPFCDRSLTRLIEAQQSFTLEPLPAGPRVPRRLRRILLRGLATRPEDRWASMGELLAALERLVEPRRWPVAATLVVGFGIGALVFAATSDDPCDGADAALEHTWGAADASAVEKAFLGSGHPEAVQLHQRVEAELDAYTRAWKTTHEDSCRATFVHHTQTESAFDQHLRCLQRHHDRLRATIDALADVSSASEALSRVALPFKLPALGACVDLEAAAPTLTLPDDPDERAKVMEVRREVDRANTLGEAGAMGEALEAALAAVASARAAGHEPVLAEALETLGRLQTMGNDPQAEATLHEAIESAARAKDDTMAARAWSTLIYTLMTQYELDRGLWLRFAATASVDRAGDPVARAWLLNNLGTLYGQRREYGKARELFEQALEAKRSLVGDDHVDTAVAWFNLGNALKEERSLDQARDAFEHARTIFLATVGPSHPHMASLETGLGHVRQLQDDLPEAAEHQMRALDIRERAFGKDHLQVAKSLEYLGKVRLLQRRLDEAAADLRRALEIYERNLGPDNAQLGLSALPLAQVELLRGHDAAARVLTERAIELLDAAGDRRERANAHFMLARLLEREPDGSARAHALALAAREALEGFERDEVDAWLLEHPLAAPASEPPEE